MFSGKIQVTQRAMSQGFHEWFIRKVYQFPNAPWTLDSILYSFCYGRYLNIKLSKIQWPVYQTAQYVFVPGFILNTSYIQTMSVFNWIECKMFSVTIISTILMHKLHKGKKGPISWNVQLHMPWLKLKTQWNVDRINNEL